MSKNRDFVIFSIVKWIIIIGFLLLSWLLLTYWYIIRSDASFSVLSYTQPRSSILSAPKGKLLKGQTITGEFMAQDNNLGIIAVRFETFRRPKYEDEDYLLFQLKEKGTTNWYYQNTYRDGFVYDIPFLPFGFPIIHNSKGKVYDFKITSLYGNDNNSVALSGRDQVFVTKYKYYFSNLKENKKLFISFLVKKIIYAMRSTDTKFASFVYALPLLFYLFLTLPLGKLLVGNVKKNILDTLKQNKIITTEIVLLIVVCVDAFYLQLRNDQIYLLVIILWVIMERLTKKTSTRTYILAILLVLLSPLFMVMHFDRTAENVSAWGYLFLWCGLILSLLEIKKNSQKNFTQNEKRKVSLLLTKKSKQR